MQFSFHVREVEPEEIDQVLSMIGEVFPDADVNIDDMDRVFIAEKPDRIIGFAHVTESCRRIILQGIGVIENTRNMGVGTALMEKVVELSEVSDKPVYLMAEGLNPAVNLYENFGFYAKKFGADRHLLVKKVLS